MGYYIDQKELNVKISINNKDEILKIFKHLSANEQLWGKGGSSSSKKWYSFANNFKYSDYIVDMFKGFRYECRKTSEFFIIDGFLGEKLGQDYLFWKQFKHIITKDSTCKFYGEEDSILDFLV